MSAFIPARRSPIEHVQHALWFFRHGDRRAARATAAAWAVPAVAAVFLLCVLCFRTNRIGANAAALTELPAMAVDGPDAAVLTTGPTTVERRYGFVTVLGEVENASRSTLGNVEAVVELYDVDRRLLGVESALLELPALKPGETSAFRVQAHDSAGLAAYRIRFRHLLGGSIPSARQ